MPSIPAGQVDLYVQNEDPTGPGGKTFAWRRTRSLSGQMGEFPSRGSHSVGGVAAGRFVKCNVGRTYWARIPRLRVDILNQQVRYFNWHNIAGYPGGQGAVSALALDIFPAGAQGDVNGLPYVELSLNAGGTWIIRTKYLNNPAYSAYTADQLVNMFPTDDNFSGVTQHTYRYYFTIGANIDNIVLRVVPHFSNGSVLYTVNGTVVADVTGIPTCLPGDAAMSSGEQWQDCWTGGYDAHAAAQEARASLYTTSDQWGSNQAEMEADLPIETDYWTSRVVAGQSSTQSSYVLGANYNTTGVTPQNQILSKPTGIAAPQANPTAGGLIALSSLGVSRFRQWANDWDAQIVDAGNSLTELADGTVGNFGQTGTGTGFTGSVPADYMSVTKFTMNDERDQVVSALGIYIKAGVGASDAQLFRGVIYSDSAGAPGTLLASTQKGVVARTATTPFFLEIPFSGADAGTPPIILQRNKVYWIGIHAGQANGACNFGIVNPGNGTAVYKLSQSFNSGPPSSFGTPTGSDGVEGCYYVKYASTRKKLTATIANATDGSDRAVKRITTAGLLPQGQEGRVRFRFEVKAGLTNINNNTSLCLLTNSVNAGAYNSADAILDVFINSSKKICLFSAAGVIYSSGGVNAGTTTIVQNTEYIVEIAYKRNNSIDLWMTPVADDGSLGTTVNEIHLPSISGASLSAVAMEARFGIDHFDGASASGWTAIIRSAQYGDLASSALLQQLVVAGGGGNAQVIFSQEDSAVVTALNERRAIGAAGIPSAEQFGSFSRSVISNDPSNVDVKPIPDTGSLVAIL